MNKNKLPNDPELLKELLQSQQQQIEQLLDQLEIQQAQLNESNAANKRLEAMVEKMQHQLLTS